MGKVGGGGYWEEEHMSYMSYSCHYIVFAKLCPGHLILFVVLKGGYWFKFKKCKQIMSNFPNSFFFDFRCPPLTLLSFFKGISLWFSTPLSLSLSRSLALFFSLYASLSLHISYALFLACVFSKHHSKHVPSASILVSGSRFDP